jgi:hypothetical protein
LNMSEPITWREPLKKSEGSDRLKGRLGALCYGRS